MYNFELKSIHDVICSMLMGDYGIILEMLGFIILLLVSGRNPKERTIVAEDHEVSEFDNIRQKIIPDKVVNMFLIIGIAMIICGLSFQFSYFNPQINQI